MFYLLWPAIGLIAHIVIVYIQHRKVNILEYFFAMVCGPVVILPLIITIAREIRKRRAMRLESCQEALEMMGHF